MSTASDYTFAVAHIRSLEPKIFSANMQERMLGSEDFESALAVLNDIDYGKHIAALSKKESYRRALDNILYESKELFMKIAPGDGLRFLWLPYEAQNLRIIIKAHLSSKTDYEALGLSLLSDLDEDEIISFLKNPEARSDLSPDMQSFLIQTLEAYREDNNPELVDWMVDAWLMRAYHHELQKAKGLTKRYLELRLDLMVIKTVIRAKVLEDEPDLKILIPVTARLNKEKVLALYENMDPLLDVLKEAGLEEVYEAASEAYKNRNFAALEQQSQDMCLDSLRTAKWQAFGPDPIAAYFLAREANCTIIANILAGKLNALERREIEKYLIKAY